MKWKALILGGGGALAEFQVGALKVVSEKYASFDMYLGVGAGSLNSSLLAQYDNLQEGYSALRECWDNIKRTKDIFDVPLIPGLSALAAFIGIKDSIYGHKKLSETIDKHISWNKLEGKNNWGTEIASLDDGQLYTITNNKALLEADVNACRRIALSLDPANEFFIGKKIVQLLTAAGSVPFLIKPVNVFGHHFIEGGVRDCIPFELAVKAFEIAYKQGYKEAEFIIIDNLLNDKLISQSPIKQWGSGREILTRTIILMSVQITNSNLEIGIERFRKINNEQPRIITIQPATAYAFDPLAFGDKEMRQKLRDDGIYRARQVLETINDPSLSSSDSEKITTVDKISKLLKDFENNPDKVQLSNQIVQLALTKPQFFKDAYVKTYKEKLDSPSVDRGFEDFPPPTYPLTCEKPDNLDQLIKLMEEIKKDNRKIKAVGAGYAFDIIHQTPGVQICLSKLKSIKNPENKFLNDPSSGLLEFEAGATIDELNKYLDKQGRALINQPGFERLNFLGVASVGGHGSGIRIGPIADSIVSINLLTFEGEKVKQKRIEKTNGITKPDEFDLAFPDIELVQDDDCFDAVKVSMGCMGVIYSLIIETQPKYFLKEKRKIKKWDDVKPSLSEKLKDSNIHSVHIWFNPYPIRGKYFCVLTEYIKTNRPPQGERGIGVTAKNTPVFAEYVLLATLHFPEALPALLHSSLLSTVNHFDPVILPCYDALNFGTPNLVPVVATNCGIRATDGSNYDIVTQAADKLLALASQLRKMGQYINSPFGFRFTAASPSNLAPQFERESCMIELPILKNTPSAEDTIKQFLDLMNDKPFEGRPHWGQKFYGTIDPNILEKMYTKHNVNRFKAVKKRFNDGTFDNHFTRMIGL